MSIFQNVVQLFSRKIEKPVITVQTVYPTGYTQPKTKPVIRTRILKCKTAHDCEKCGTRLYCGSFVYRREKIAWGQSYFYFRCLDCAKEFKRMNNNIQANQGIYNKNNIWAKLRSKE